MSFPRRGPLLVVGALVLLLAAVLPRPDLRAPVDAFDRYLDGRSFGARPPAPPADAEPAFRDAATGETVPTARGAVFAVNDAVRPHFWGTYLGGDEWTGHLYGEAFTVDAPFLYLPVTGYPASAGNGLFVAFSAPRDPDQVLAVVRYEGANPQEAVAMWELDVRRFRGARARVEMFDGIAAPTGWLGAGRPLSCDRGGLGVLGPGDFGNTLGGYAYFWWGALVATAVLWTPGMARRAWREAGARTPRRNPVSRPPGRRRGGEPGGPANPFYGVLARQPPVTGRHPPASLPRNDISTFGFADAAWLALPGLLLLTGFGLALWLTGWGRVFALGRLYLFALGVLALSGALVAGRRGNVTARAASGGGRLALAGYAGLVLAVLQFSVVPLTVERESFAGANQRGRMVCSPPDHATPYATAVFLLHGHGGHERGDLYFGAGWSLTSRGPLAPLGVAALLNVFGVLPPDPPQSGEYAWPADAPGFFVARVFGVLTNALVVLALAALAARLAPAGRAGRAGVFALGWAAVCPLVFLNTAYVWPKLLAAACALLAAEGVLAGGAGAWRVGGLLALGYYAHPVGALLAPGVVALRMATLAGGRPGGGWRRRAAVGATVAAACAACLLPWLAYQRAIGGPPGRFARYPLGDGRGYQDALGAGSWALARAKNVYYTLVPAAFHFSDETPDWFEAPLRGAARWNVAYAKGLPGHLGYGAFWMAYAAVLGWGWAGGGGGPTVAARGLRGWVVLATFTGMVLVWGFNADGLGRNCLEGLSPFVLALGAAWAGAAAWPAAGGGRAGAVILAVVALETAWVMFSGFFMAGRFQAASGLPAARWAQLGALGLTWAGLLALVVRAWRRAVSADEEEGGQRR